MAKDTGSQAGDVFDVRKVRRLVELMNEYDLAQIDLRQADQRIRLRRGAEPVVSALPVPAVPLAPAAPPVVSPSPDAPAQEKVADFKSIKSPIVGTFYASPNPESAPFVKVGDQVGADTTVCIIEAMKVFNEVPAECSGKIVAVLVEPGDAVEFGQPLFQLE